MPPELCCAEGAVSLLVRHGTDSPWRTWGNAPGLVKSESPALKARFTFWASLMHDWRHAPGDLRHEKRAHETVAGSISSTAGKYVRYRSTSRVASFQPINSACAPMKTSGSGTLGALPPP